MDGAEDGRWAAPRVQVASATTCTALPTAGAHLHPATPAVPPCGTLVSSSASTTAALSNPGALSEAVCLLQGGSCLDLLAFALGLNPWPRTCLVLWADYGCHLATAAPRALS